MSEYIIILIVAIITIPLTFLLILRKKLQRSTLFIVLSGLFIALTGIYIGQNFPFYYTILVMFGLAFALSVLLDKRLSRKVVVKDLQHEEVFVGKPKGEIELQQFIEEESAATIEIEDIIIDKSSDDDLENWMSDTQKNTIRPKEEHERSGE